MGISLETLALAKQLAGGGGGSGGGSGGGGGSALPEVTSEDNGKVLSVVDGEWAANSIDAAGAGYSVEIQNGKTVAMDMSMYSTEDTESFWYGVYQWYSDSYIPFEDADSIIVTMDNGSPIEIPKNIELSEYNYAFIFGEMDEDGHPIFTNYPIYVYVYDDGSLGYILSQTDIDHIVITGRKRTVVPTEDFKLAAAASVNPGYESKNRGTVFGAYFYASESQKDGWDGIYEHSNSSFDPSGFYIQEGYPLYVTIDDEDECAVYAQYNYETDNGYIYGEMTDSGVPDFTNYPFCIVYDWSEGLTIYTQTSGYWISVDAECDEYVEVSSEFYNAVKSCGGVTMLTDGSTYGSVRGINAQYEGQNYTMGRSAFAVGDQTMASGENSFAEGNRTHAGGRASHAEGNGSLASGENSHAEGLNTEANGSNSHAEGLGAIASGYASHAEGRNTTASDDSAHAEGYYTTASGENSHAEGSYTIASGDGSHAEGISTIAKGSHQHVFGKYNIEDPDITVYTGGTYVEIVGNGNYIQRSNARTLDWNGNEVLSGKLTVGADPTNPMDVATKKYVDQNGGGMPASANAGDFLVYNGTAWVAQAVPSANGVSF